jgi:hypothetical protein
MFEQSLYGQKPAATPEGGTDLFKNYEIKNWDMSGRIYRILGVSAIANIFVILIFAQTSLLTMKGCDSPLVGRVCQVLDTVYVGSMLFGTDREVVDAVYDKTSIGDSEITFVDVSGVTPPLAYPEGYFQIANPNEYQAMLDQINNPTLGDTSGLTSTFPSTGGSLIDTPPVLPPSNPNVITGDLPSFGGDTTSSYKPPRTRKPGRPRVTPDLPDEDDTAVVEKPAPSPTPTPEVGPTPMSSEEVKAVNINKQPLADFADDVAIKWDAKEVDLNQEFTVVLNGVLAADGTLDLQKSKFDTAKQKGDQKMIDVGKAALEALGKSNYLSYLKQLKVDKFSATLVQDDKSITIVITSAQKSPEMAKTVASGINAYISIGKSVTDDPSDERTLLNGAKVTSEGKNFFLNFTIPKPIAQEMITRKLKEAQAKKAQQPKPNGNLVTRPTDNTAKN